jgi:hypothetical protein
VVKIKRRILDIGRDLHARSGNCGMMRATRSPHRMTIVYIRSVSLLVAVLALQACTWVKPTEAGAAVVVAESFNVRDCALVSTITTSVKHSIGNRPRKAEKVAQELATLARNEAAIRGGDTIVPQGEVEDGARTYAVYACAGRAG